MLRDKFKWSADALLEVEAYIRSYTNHVTPAQTVDVIKADPSDNRILECAVAAKSDYIVTGTHATSFRWAACRDSDCEGCAVP